MTPLQSLVSQPWAHTLGWTLLHFIWQGAVLGLLAWVALALLRGTDAKVRYGTACAFLVLMVAAPVATFGLLQPQAMPAAIHLRLEAATPVIPGMAIAPLTQRLKSALDSSLPWLLATWVMGVLLLSTRFLGSWLRVQRLRRLGATPVPAEWHLVLSRLCRELGLGRTVRLLQSAVVEVPTALGWLRPVILLPACALSSLSPLQLEAILAHELAHIRRGDFLVNLLQSLVEVLLFYHPAVWWLSARIRAERELCCDDVAAQLCGDPLLLARALTELEALREPDSAAPNQLALAANGGSLMHRIRHLLEPALPVTSGARATALAVLAASLLGAAGVVLQDKEPASKPEQHTRMKVIDGDRQMDVRIQGEVQLDPAAKEPAVVPGDGSFRIEETKSGKARTYRVSKDKRTYTVDGQEQPLDAEGEAWVRSVVKDAAKAKAKTGRDKGRVMEIRTRHLEDRAHEMEAHGRAMEDRFRKMDDWERALDTQSHDMEARTADLERRYRGATPEEKAKLQAEGERLKAEGTKLKAEGERMKAEGERLKHDPELKALIARAEKEGRKVRVEVIEKDGALPGAATADLDGHRKQVVVKRYKIKKGGTLGEDHEFSVIEPGDEDMTVAGMDQDIHVRIPRIRVHTSAHPQGDTPQVEVAEIKAELRALQTRLDRLQEQMAQAPEPPKPPDAPKPPIPHPPKPPKVPGAPPTNPTPPPAPPPPPPPPPAPDAPPPPPPPPTR